MNKERSKTSVSDLLRWCIVVTRHRDEVLASKQLSETGLECYLPLMESDRIVYGKPRRIVKPLFPQYLFVRCCFETDTAGINRTIGVKSVLTCNGRVAEVTDEIVTYFKARENRQGVIRADRRFRTGQEVRIKRGPLKDLHAVFIKELSDFDRVQVLLKAVGWSSKVELHPGYLEAV